MNKDNEVDKGNNCFNCVDRQHKSKECPMRDKGPRCFRCNDFGHRARECKLTVNSRKHEDRTCSVLRRNFTKHYKTLLINGVEFKTLIDTASDLSLL